MPGRHARFRKKALSNRNSRAAPGRRPPMLERRARRQDGWFAARTFCPTLGTTRPDAGQVFRWPRVSFGGRKRFWTPERAVRTPAQEDLRRRNRIRSRFPSRQDRDLPEGCRGHSQAESTRPATTFEEITGATLPRRKQAGPRRHARRLLCLRCCVPRSGREAEGGNSSRDVPIGSFPPGLPFVGG